MGAFTALTVSMPKAEPSDPSLDIADILVDRCNYYLCDEGRVDGQIHCSERIFYPAEQLCKTAA
jgi:hypothetical protein